MIDHRSFVARQREAQSRHFAQACPADTGYRGSSYRLNPERFAQNLIPSIRDEAVSYFAAIPPISWHTHCNHGLSSQVCCLNFLMPLARNEQALSQFIGHCLGIAPPEMVPLENRAGLEWYIAFEWFPERDYLNEANKQGNRTRGANATSADASVRFKHEGKLQHVLIEWKFTEKYGAPLNPSGRVKRVCRYDPLWHAPNGPIRSDLGLKLEDLFWEPFYQLCRQQMMAWHMENDPDCPVERAQVLHLSPSANRPLHKVTSPQLRQFGNDAFEVFRHLLVQPDDFIGLTIGDAFAFLKSSDEDYAAYLSARYAELLDD
jgi:restriction endonuclease-like protein